MSTFFRIVEVVLPVFLIVVFGYFASKRGLLTKGFLDGGSKSVYTVFMPLLMFTSVYGTGDLDIVDPMLVILIILAQFVIIGISYFVYEGMGFDREDMAILIQTSVRSNIVLFGLALARNYYGDTEVSIIAIYIGVVSAFSNGFAIVIYEVLTRTGDNVNPIQLLKGILKNPILIAALLALSFNVIDVKVYGPVLKALKDIGGMATPLGLICIGGILKLESTAEESRVVKASVLSKALIIPVVVVSFFVLIGVRGPELFLVLLMFAAPIAVSSHAMSCIYTTKGDLCAKIIMYSTLVNSLTIFIALYVLSVLNLL